MLLMQVRCDNAKPMVFSCHWSCRMMVFKSRKYSMTDKCCSCRKMLPLFTRRCFIGESSTTPYYYRSITLFTYCVRAIFSWDHFAPVSRWIWVYRSIFENHLTLSWTLMSVKQSTKKFWSATWETWMVLHMLWSEWPNCSWNDKLCFIIWIDILQCYCLLPTAESNGDVV